MIKKTYLIPEFYIHKEPYCDECKIPLKDAGRTLMVNPPLHVYKCPRCGVEYNLKEADLQGEWKWRSI